ncbi:MAG: acyl-CoA dehydrogenase family protein [Desulfobacterales bacterium]
MNDKVRVETPEQMEFRAHCIEWLSKNHPGPAPAGTPRQAGMGHLNQEQFDFLRGWQMSAYDGGLVGCDFPKECGGGGRTNCQQIANEEMQRIGTPIFPGLTALLMAAATIMTHGTEEQKKRFIGPMLSGEEIWCQGFSEPNAGSDLANQQTFAERKGDGWVVNGSKIWTSMGEYASLMILICRTDRSHKHKGLTYFICPMGAGHEKSVEVRPLVKITGETGFNEVFFTNHEIPDEYRLDEVGKGWAVAMTTLQHERGAAGLVMPFSGGQVSKSAIDTAATSLIDLAKRSPRNGKTAAADPVLRDRIMQLVIRQAGQSQNGRRGGVKGLLDHPMRLAMQGKVVGTEITQDVTALALEIVGAYSTMFFADKNAPDGGQWPHEYLNSFGNTIAAGTSEIQRNQLGERILGMPKTK